MGVIIMHKSVGDFTLGVQITVAAVYEAQDILKKINPSLFHTQWSRKKQRYIKHVIIFSQTDSCTSASILKMVSLLPLVST